MKNEATQAIEQAGEVSRAAATETRTQAGTPEMQKVGEQLRTAGHAVAKRSGEATDTLRAKAHDLSETARETASEARADLTDRVERVKYKAHEVKEDVKIKAEAVGETGRRAARAPGRIRHELGEAFTAWKRGVVASLAGMAMMAVFALTAFIVLTVALVVGLNQLLFDPAGTWIVAGLYLVCALVAYGVAKGAKTRAAHETEERIANAKEEVRHVGRPVREAFTRGRPGI